MHIGLFAIGLAIVVAGIAAIGYGIPVNEFSFGNTLIVSGTVAIVGGFLLIGVAAAVQQLKRIAEGDILHQAQMPAPMRSPEPFKQFAQSDMPTGQGMAPMPSMPARLDTSPRAPSMPEPRLAVSPSVEGDPLEWLRPKEKTTSKSDQSVIEEMEASLSPQPAPQPVSPPPPLKIYDQSFEAKPLAPNGPIEQGVEFERAFRQEPAPRPAPPPPPPVEHPAQTGQTGVFETVWPEIRPARHPETIARARKPDTVAPPRDEGIARGQASARKDVPREAQSAAPEEPRPVAILKSGMIDGMAYTLYADGSIEAVLPTGTVRFASIDALRIHLEKNG